MPLCRPDLTILPWSRVITRGRHPLWVTQCGAHCRLHITAYYITSFYDCYLNPCRKIVAPKIRPSPREVLTCVNNNQLRLCSVPPRPHERQADASRCERRDVPRPGRPV